MMHHQCIGGNGGSELLVGSICLTPLKLLENYRSFHMEGGRRKVRIIGFMGPSGRPCVPRAERALQHELTVISSDSPKPSNTPKSACIKWSLKSMPERDLTVPMAELR